MQHVEAVSVKGCFFSLLRRPLDVGSAIYTGTPLYTPLYTPGYTLSRTAGYVGRAAQRCKRTLPPSKSGVIPFTMSRCEF